MSTQTSDLYDVIRHIRPAFKHIAKSVEHRSKQADLTIGMRAVLERLIEHGSHTVPDIARSLLVERQYIQRSVNELLAAQLVTREENPVHKKSWLIALTDIGTARFSAVKQREMDTLREISKQFSDKEISAAIKVLAALSDEFAALNRRETE